MENHTSTEDEINLHSLLPDEELDDNKHAVFRQEVLDNPLFKDLLIYQNGTK